MKVWWKFSVYDFIFPWFDAKRLNRAIKYLRKLRNLQDIFLGTYTCTWYFFLYMHLVFLRHFWYFYKSLNFYLCIAEFYMSLVFTTCVLVHLFSNWTCSLTSTYIWYFICILYINMYLETLHDCILTWSSWYKYFCLSLIWGFTSQYWHKHLLVPVHVYMYIC